MNIIPTRLDMIKEAPAGSVGAEIGVYRADFSEQILKETDVGHLYLVDPWVRQEGYNDTINLEDQEGHYRETIRKVRPFVEARRCSVIRGFSAKVANGTLVPQLDWVLIDAYHAFEAALEDITLWSKRVKEGGFLLAHDYFEGPKYGHDGHEWTSGVVQACEDFCREYGWEVTAVTAEDLPTAKLERLK